MEPPDGDCMIMVLLAWFGALAVLSWLSWLCWRRCFAAMRPVSECVEVGAPRACTRVQFVGAAGSGKSTLARAVAARLGLGYVRLDDHKGAVAGWQQGGAAAFEASVRGALAAASPAAGGQGWVCDGNYHVLGGSRRLASPPAEVVIWLDYSILVSSLRFAQRALGAPWPPRSVGAALCAPVALALAAMAAPVLWQRNLGRRRAYCADLAAAREACARGRSGGGAPATLVRFATPAEAEAYTFSILT